MLNLLENILPNALGNESSFLPVQASKVSVSVDTLYNFLTFISIVVFVILMGAMVYFIIRYRRRTEQDKVEYLPGSNILEFIWSFIPFVTFLGIFYWGWVVYKNTREFPEDAINIHVTGFQWAWAIQYENGKTAANELTVPVNERVILSMRSKDVLHSFFIPSFRIKQDVVPGYITKLSFVPTKVGRYRIFCAEYCGTAHSGMIGWVNVVEKPSFIEYLNTDETKGFTLVELGERTYKSLCIVCHSTDGSKVIGPSFKGLYGSIRALADGSTITGDDNYIRESILNPNAVLVEGFPSGQMPMFQGTLSEEQVTQVIEYIKSLK